MTSATTLLGEKSATLIHPFLPGQLLSCTVGPLRKPGKQERTGQPSMTSWVPAFLCAGHTGMVKGMKESNDEGIASHIGPESCAAARKSHGEALTGVGAGQVLSRERGKLRDADAVGRGGRRNPARRYRETRRSPARSETLRTRGITMHGNREIRGLPAVTGTAGRDGKPKGKSRR